jgi:HPt (histidine-containing phosphotransfer) domain-containing protein
MSQTTVYIDIDLKELIPMFLESRQEDILALRLAMTEGDYATLKTIGHTLKGVGGGYGFDFITDIGNSIELAAKEEDDTHIEKLINSMEDSLTNLKIIYEE